MKPFKRQLLSILQEWRNSDFRKPLVLRGARQVGKSTIIRDLGQTFDNYIELNLEKAADVKLFEGTDDVKIIMDSILLSRKIASKSLHKTLLFIDEIQESPKAIQLLRYFYEEIPALHLIAAGSLLEFALKEVPSFPVGRVEYRYLHPFNFQEYLGAINHQAALNQLNTIPVKEFAHDILKELFHRYVIMGGMPEAIQKYVKDETLTGLPTIYESIWKTYQDDVEKYAESSSERKVIKHIMGIAHTQLDKRITFQNFGGSTYKSREVSEALRKLNDARIIQLIYPTTDVEFPVIPDIKKSPRLHFLDTGLVTHSLGIQSELLGLSDYSDAFKGAIIPHIITQELLSINSITDKKPNFWVRQKKQSSAEVDLVYTHKGLIIPIEIKSGLAGKLKSLHQFINQCSHNYAIRIYGGNYSVENHTTPEGKPYILMNLPYYLGTKIPEYIAELVSNN